MNEILIKINNPEPEEQKCQCIDSTKLKVTYAPKLSELASLEEVRKKSFNFHEPIGDFYNNLFYINYQFNINLGNGLWCTFDLLAFKEIYLNIPDKNGIKLILNCVLFKCVISKNSAMILHQKRWKYAKWLKI